MNLFLAVTDNDWFRFLRSRAPLEDDRIGCILLSQPFFFDESEWETARSSGCQTTPGKGRSGSFWSGMGIWCFGGET